MKMEKAKAVVLTIHLEDGSFLVHTLKDCEVSFVEGIDYDERRPQQVNWEVAAKKDIRGVLDKTTCSACGLNVTKCDCD